MYGSEAAPPLTALATAMATHLVPQGKDSHVSRRPPTPVALRRGRGEGFLSPNIHDIVHVRAGGHMTLQDSPNDPVFWLHHCNIDRLRSQWQARWGFGTNCYPPAGTTSGVVDLNEAMQPWSGVTSASVLEHRGIYTYG
jgi:hypothetical protein